MTTRLFQFGLILILSACAGQAPLPDSVIPDQRSARLAELHSWQVGGRIALSDGQDGGSGRFDWVHRDDWQSLDFSGALGRGAWKVEGRPGALLLRTGEGEYQAESLEQLVAEHIGWPVPVEQLAWWIRGLAWPGDVPDVTRDAAGLPATLVQSGWHIDYRRWQPVDNTWLPDRIDARHGDYSIKLALRGWQITPQP